MITTTVVEKGATPRNLLKGRALNNVVRAMVYDMGVHWHVHFREKHFTQAGAAEYGYTPRTKGYMIRKARVMHHQNPLEFSGRSRALSAIRDVRPTATKGEGKVRVVLHTPALNFIPKGGRINLRDEMTRVSGREVVDIAKVASDSETREMRNVNETTTTVIQ